MTLLICLPLILVILGLLARRWFIASRQDIRSIESHRSSLDHLEHLGPEEFPQAGAQSGAAHVRIVGGSGQARPAVRPMVWARPDGRPPAARPAWHSARPEPVQARYAKALQEAHERTAADERPPIVITDDAVAAGRPAATPATRSTPGRVTRRLAPPPETTTSRAPAPPTPPPADPGPVPAAPVAAEPDPVPAAPTAAEPDPVPAAPAPADPGAGPRRHRRQGQRRTVRVLATAAGLMVVAAGVGVAVEELHPGGGHGHPARQAAGPPPSAVSPSTTVPPAPTSTTPPSLTAVRSTSTDALYSVPAGPLQVSISASGSCWVEMRTGSPTGPISYEGTLQPGASQTFASPGGLWLRLGDPSGVQLRINGSPVSLPGDASPYNVTVTTAA